jgi:uncharacterized C2H2 Zn-finger protein
MESSEHNSPSPNDEVFYPSTASANLHWYYYWSSQVGYSETWDSQMIGSGSGQWNYHLEQFRPGNHSDSESTSHPPETFNFIAQGQANYHSFGGSTGYSSQQASPEMVPQTAIDRGYQDNEPFFSSWAPEVAVYPQTEAQSRRPSHHSDPGFPTHMRNVATHRPLTNLQHNTAFTTQTADAHGIERANAPLADLSASTDPSPSADPSFSATSSPVSEYVNRATIRCYDHGCDGRTFSSISNYRRHQRERAGQSPMCFCPRCGAVFYRRWTRDHHVERGSCLRTHRSN